MNISTSLLNYKTLDESKWNKFPGKLSGSSHPGFRKNATNEESLRYILDDLKFISDQNIKYIYSLTPDNEPIKHHLIQSIWQNNFKDSHYVTEINNISLAVEDFNPPTQKQLDIISVDVIEHLKNGDNVLIHCTMGIGRTGTLISGVYMRAFGIHNAQEAITYIRENYLSGAVETDSQIEALENFKI